MTIRSASQTRGRRREPGGDRREAEAEREDSEDARRQRRGRSRRRARDLPLELEAPARARAGRACWRARRRCLAAPAPRPAVFVLSLGVCIASPVDDLRQHDPGHECRADDDEQRPGPLPLRASSSGCGRELRARRRAARAGFWFVGASPLRAPRSGSASACAGTPRRRQLLGEPRRRRPRRGHAVGELLQPVGAAIDELVGLASFLAGGASPVAMRQICARRGAPPSSRPRRGRRRDRSRAACAACPDRCLTMTRQTWGLLYPVWTEGAAREGRAAAADRERRLAQADRHPARAGRGAREGGLPRHAGHRLARHPRARAREDERRARPAALRRCPAAAARDPRDALARVLRSSAARDARRRTSSSSSPSSARRRRSPARSTASSTRSSSARSPATTRAS